ncbi:MAG: hypothetical protein GXP63_02655 [DPANN group archaeon]|nr:hypothetical protein [DPANN group archaeon]
MIRGKKALSTFTVLLVILLLSFAIYVPILGKSLNTISRASDKAACKRGIFLTYLGKSVNPLGSNTFYSVDCKPGEVILDTKGTNNVLNKERTAIDTDKANKLVADAMAQCWDTVGAGKYDPFSDWNLKDRPICFYCDTIWFDKSLLPYLRSMEKPEIAGLERYLTGHNGPFDKDHSYWQYLYKQDPKKADFSNARKGTEQEVKDGSQIILQMVKLQTKLSRYFSITDAGPWPWEDFWGSLASSFPLTYPFTDCEECHAIGGIYLVPPEFSPTKPVEIIVGGDKMMMPFCSLFVNAPSPMKDR